MENDNKISLQELKWKLVNILSKGNIVKGGQKPVTKRTYEWTEHAKKQRHRAHEAVLVSSLGIYSNFCSNELTKYQTKADTVPSF